MSGLGSVLGLATGGIWKYATIGIGVVSLLGIASIGIDDVMVHRERNSYLTEMKAAVTRAAQDEANNETMQASIAAQNAQLDALALASKTKLAAAALQVQEAQAKQAGLEAQVDLLLNKPLVGADKCSRMDDADTRVLGDLK